MAFKYTSRVYDGVIYSFFYQANKSTVFMVELVQIFPVYVLVNSLLFLLRFKLPISTPPFAHYFIDWSLILDL